MRYSKAVSMCGVASVLAFLCGCTSPHISSGKISLQQGNYDAAIEQFTLAIDEEPEKAEAYYWRGIAHARKKLWDEYVRDTEKAFSLDSTLIKKAAKEKEPDVHSVYFFCSARRTFFEYKQYELSLKRAETSLFFDPKNFLSMNLKALCLAELKRDDEAEKSFKKAIETRPGYIDTYIYLAGFYKSKTDYENEEETLRRAKKIVDNPDWFGTVDEDSLKIKKTDAANIYHDLGANLFNQYELDEAQQMLTKAMEFDPNSRDITYDLGMVLAEQENWQEASKIFGRVIKIDSLDLYAHFYLGFSLLMLKEYRNAIEEFTRVIEQDPDCCDAYFKRAMCHRELDNTVAAYEDVKCGKECEKQRK